MILGTQPELLLHPLLDTRRDPVLAPPFWGLAALEVLTRAGGADQVVGLQWISAATHQDRPIVLGLHVMPQDQLGRTLDATIDGLGQDGLGPGGHQSDRLTKRPAIRRGDHDATSCRKL